MYITGLSVAVHHISVTFSASQKCNTFSADSYMVAFEIYEYFSKKGFFSSTYLIQFMKRGANQSYEGCQESSWTHMITASNVPDFDIHYYFSLK